MANKSDYKELTKIKLENLKKGDGIRAFHCLYDSKVIYDGKKLDDELIVFFENLAIEASEQADEINESHDELAKIENKDSTEYVNKLNKLNPKVGAILVRATVGSNIYEVYGCCRGAFDLDNHAEYSLINSCMNDRPIFTESDYFFTTLEPCTQNTRNHWSRSCAKILSEREVHNIYIGLFDPNPLIRGRGYYELFMSTKNNNHKIEVIPFRYEQRKRLVESNKEYLKKFEIENADIYRNIFLTLKPYIDEDAINYYMKLSDYPSGDGDIDKFYCFYKYMIMRDYIGKNNGCIGLFKPIDSFILFFYKNPTSFIDGASIRIIVPNEKPIIWEHPISYFYDGLEFNNGKVKSLLEIILDKYGNDKMKIDIGKYQHGTEERNEEMKNAFNSFGYNPEVVREAIINAIVHRDYSSGVFTTINLNDDEIVVTNPIDLNKLNEDGLEKLKTKEAISNPPNPKLMRLFMDIKATERAGFGMEEFKNNDNVTIEVESGFILKTTIKCDESLKKGNNKK